MNRKVTLIGLSLIALMFVSLGLSADSGQGIEYEYTNGIARISTANITVSVNAPGNIPTMHIKTTGGLEYTVIFKQLIEYEDLNDDGVFQYNETVEGAPMIALTSIQWIFSGFVTDEVGGEIQAIHFNFTSDEVVGPAFDDLNVTIAMHLYLADQIINGYELIGAAEFKFDLYISGFEFSEVDSLMALRFDITPGEGYQIKNHFNQLIDTSINTAGDEEKVAQTTALKQRFMIENDENGAFFGYAKQCRVMNESTWRVGGVNASISTVGDGSLQLYLSFEQFVELQYDPSLGTEDSGEETESTSSSWVAFITIPIVAFAALTISKRNKKK